MVESTLVILCPVTPVGLRRAQLEDGIYKDFTKDQAFKNPGEAGYRPKPPPATASAAPAPSLARAPRSRRAHLLVTFCLLDSDTSTSRP